MKKNRFKRLVLIHIVLIIILFGLIIKITMQEDNYSCNQCTIKFTKWQGYGPSKTKLAIEVPLQRLHESYLEDECPVEWDKSNSYIFAEDFDITVTSD